MALTDPRTENPDGALRPWWRGVEVRHFAALAAIADEGSFRGAAEALGYVQSAVSQQLAQLESLVGEELVIRRRGSAPVALTEAGELLLVHAHAILARFGAAYADLEARGRVGGPSLRIGVLESVETHLMPRVLPPLLEREPGLRVVTTAARDSAAMLALLEAGELDAAFCPGVQVHPPLMSLRLLSEPFLLVVPAGSELAIAGAVPELDQVSRLDLIGHDLMSGVDRQLHRAGVTLNFVVRAHSNAAVQALVGSGLGAAIMPALAVDGSDPRVACVPLDGLVAPGALSLVWQRGRRLPGPLRQFVELAERTGQALQYELDQRLAAVAGEAGLTHIHPRTAIRPALGVAVGEGA